MGFWIFMLVMDLLLPGVMLWFGSLFLRGVPREINPVFGYRTAMSMKNRDTWAFAHRYCGRLWFRLGLILLPLSVIPLLVVISSNVGTIGIVGGVVCGVQSVPLLGTVILTERALRRTFDRTGRRKKG